MLKPLPAPLRDFLFHSAESGMGYQTGDIRLHSGTVFRDVVFLEGALSGVRHFKDLPFEPEDIAEITLTHRRWPWQE